MSYDGTLAVMHLLTATGGRADPCGAFVQGIWHVLHICEVFVA
jgi:hypothetical protein